ncbi:hypothetical protein ATN81_08855 [Agrobacterium pusense]|nr:hypothetical protein ATN81_08855 [Agrobacterium pusense]OJH60014.1 hypothetical protein BA725_09900 [Agrobacterium pusense]
MVGGALQRQVFTVHFAPLAPPGGSAVQVSQRARRTQTRVQEKSLCGSGFGTMQMKSNFKASPFQPTGHDPGASFQRLIYGNGASGIIHRQHTCLPLSF